MDPGKSNINYEILRGFTLGGSTPADNNSTLAVPIAPSRFENLVQEYSKAKSLSLVNKQLTNETEKDQASVQNNSLGQQSTGQQGILEDNSKNDTAEYIPVTINPTLLNGVHEGTQKTSDASALPINNTNHEPPYWMSHCKTISSPLLRLHQEIVSLVELLAPTTAEEADRQAAVAQVEAVIQSMWPQATVKLFGSFATGLYVPTSDVDLVVLNSQIDVQKGLKALASKLSNQHVAKQGSVEVISKAKVPIIKFVTEDHGGLSFDISFDVPNGPQAAGLVRDVIQDWPMMKPLVLILKLFLQQRELNEVYTGGIGSYALITSLIAFLQLHNSRRRVASGSSSRNPRVKPPASPLEPSLGVLLIDFFRLYGRVIDMRRVGISATGGGHYFVKSDKDGENWVEEGKEYKLSVEDPKDPSNDIGRGSFNVMRVKAAFDHAYQQLAAPSRPDESLLKRILRLDAILASRQRPSNTSYLYAANAQTFERDVNVEDLPKKGAKRARTDSGDKCQVEQIEKESPQRERSSKRRHQEEPKHRSSPDRFLSNQSHENEERRGHQDGNRKRGRQDSHNSVERQRGGRSGHQVSEEHYGKKRHRHEGNLCDGGYQGHQGSHGSRHHHHHDDQMDSRAHRDGRPHHHHHHHHENQRHGSPGYRVREGHQNQRGSRHIRFDN